MLHADAPGLELRAECIGTCGLVLRPDAPIGCVVHALKVS
jgi:hypothetical protein